MAEDDLAQRDLSHLEIQQMSAAERAEMRRRYAAFVQVMAPARAASAPTPRVAAATPRRWLAGRRQ